jgi:hypothetical protein
VALLAELLQSMTTESMIRQSAPEFELQRGVVERKRAACCGLIDQGITPPSELVQRSVIHIIGIVGSFTLAMRLPSRATASSITDHMLGSLAAVLVLWCCRA